MKQKTDFLLDPQTSIIAKIVNEALKENAKMTAADKWVANYKRREEEKNKRKLKAARKGNARDGYSNPAAGLGAASLLQSSGHFLPPEMNYDLRDLTNIYRGNWLAKKIIDMPAEDMTRNWYSISTSMPVEHVQKIKDLEAKNSIKMEITNAIRWARLYGGSLAVMITEPTPDEDLSMPLYPEEVGPGEFHGLLVLDRTQGITPSEELVNDLSDPDFGLPEYYSVPIRSDKPGEVSLIHHSRVLRFVGRELPNLETQREQYWGASELEHIMDEMLKRENTSANIAELVFQANVTTLKSAEIMAMLSMGTTEVKESIMRALETENQMRTSFGVQLLGEGDDMQNLSYNFSGLSEIYEQFMMDMAGAAEIPATKLFGRSPDGMNATGESDMRNYYDMIHSLQERMLRPALEKLLPVMACACMPNYPDDMKIVFEPVMVMNARERMDMAEQHMRIIQRGIEAGVVSVDQAREELRAMSDRTGMWGKL